MEVAYLYNRPRGEFGRDVRACLRDSPARLLAAVARTDAHGADYVRRNPCNAEVDTTPRMSEHEVNTERCVLRSSSMRHVEGGWPKDVDPTEQADVTRFRKKAEKDEEYKTALKVLGPILSRGLKQNNTVDIYEEYFQEAIATSSGGGGGGSGGGEASASSAAAAPEGIILGGSGGSSGSSGSGSSSYIRDHGSEPPSAKGLAVFRDPCAVKRSATTLHWHPEGHGKLAVAYSTMTFQDPRFMAAAASSSSSTSSAFSSSSYASSSSSSSTTTRSPTSSFIWDVNSPNRPDVELVPPSPLCCLRYNPKSTDTLAGGCHNGLVAFFDLRKPGGGLTGTTASAAAAAAAAAASCSSGGGGWGCCFPQEASLIERSHHDPVYEVQWISSKTGHQCASVSTDGQLLWWDTRRLSEPTDVLALAMPTESGKQQPPSSSSASRGPPTVLGGSAMEYNLEAGPTKYLVGTEQGVVVSVNLRNRKQHNGVAPYDAGTGNRHHGPIAAIQRNPAHHKFFLTVGDWAAKVWVEDLKTPIMTTKYHPAYLTAGCWSPTRPGVFFVTRADGVVDVWDYHYRQSEVAYSHKVGDAALTAIAVQEAVGGGGSGGSGGSGEAGGGTSAGTGGGGGRLLAVGDVNGTVSLLALSRGLAECQPGEKQAIGAMLERELRREKNLELRERDLRRARAAEAEAAQQQQQQQQQQQVMGTGTAGMGGGGGGAKGAGGGKDEKMEELLRKVDADFLAMIKEAEDDEPPRGGSGSVGGAGAGGSSD